MKYALHFIGQAFHPDETDNWFHWAGGVNFSYFLMEKMLSSHSLNDLDIKERGFNMAIIMEPIGVVHTDIDRVPRHWSVSDVKGTLVIDKKYQAGLKDIQDGQQIVVIFHFHKSPNFTPDLLVQQPPHRNEKLGVFSICSPNRPNPVGMSVLDVLQVEDNVIYVQGLDMIDGTPILDLKPFVKDRYSCPSYRENQ